MTIERPASATSAEQTEPLLDVYDSSFVDVQDVQLEGVQSSGCRSGSCAGTGCASSCVNPGNAQGELNVTYDSSDLPTPGSQSGISISDSSVSDTNWTCVFVSYAEYVNVSDSSFTNCGDQSGSAAIFLAAGNETLSLNSVEYATGDGIYISTAYSNYEAYPETISRNTIENSEQFGSNTGVGQGSSPSIIEGNVVDANAAGGLQVNYGATVQDNMIYQNSGPGIQLYWTGAECGCENTITNNTFYDDTGSEIDSTNAQQAMVNLTYNIFYVASGSHVWNGPFVVVCFSGPEPYYAYVDSNDYYNESPQGSSANFQYGTNARYGDPQFVSITPGAINLEPQDPNITTDTTPAWGAFATDPSAADALSGITEGPAADPTELNNITLADNTQATLIGLDKYSDGSGDLPIAYPVLTAAQIAACNAACWSAYQLEYPPDASSEWAAGSDGVIWAPNHKGVCPEPNPDDGYGSMGNGGNGWCGYTTPQHYPLDSNCGSNGNKTCRTQGTNGGWGSSGPPGGTNFYSDLCGPGSATFIMSTWLPSLVNHYGGGVTGSNGSDKKLGILNAVGKGWYRFLYHATYDLLYFAPNAVTDGGWNSFWTFEQHFFNTNTPKSWHIAWTARKWYDGSKEKHTVPPLTLPDLEKAIHTNIAWKYLGHPGNYHNGAFLAGVSTAGLGDGWTGGPFSHYISVDASIPSYDSGQDGTGPGLAYMDTAFVSGTNIFGDGTTTGHAALVTDFLQKAIDQAGHMASGAYYSDRMIVFAQRTK